MKIVAQRVSEARVLIEGVVCGEIGPGLCLLIGVAPDDTARAVDALAHKFANLRIFDDGMGKMNRSLLDIGGSVLAISQFTLYADCRKGRRPSFIDAAPPALGHEMYERFCASLRELGVIVQTGVFGAEMRVEIVNEGPVTIVLDSADLAAKQ